MRSLLLVPFLLASLASPAIHADTPATPAEDTPILGDFILNPVLRTNAGIAASCLTDLLEGRAREDGLTVTGWRGPGVKADSGGQVDPSVAAFIATTDDPKQSYALLLLTADADGWRLFTYKEEDQLRIGYRARSLYRFGKLVPVKPRELRDAPGEPDELNDELDLMPCASVLGRLR